MAEPIASDLHGKESITTVKNVAKENALQLLVSTDGKPIRGSNTGDKRLAQVAGHIDGKTLVELSRILGGMSLLNDNGAQASSADMPSSESDFIDRYGPGVKIQCVPQPL